MTVLVDATLEAVVRRDRLVVVTALIAVELDSGSVDQNLTRSGAL